MQKNAIFTEKQPQYRYMCVGDYADVFIYSFVNQENIETDESVQTQYLYDFNMFRVKQNEITGDMIKENPLSYLDYDPNKTASLAETLQELEERQSITEQAVQDLILYTLGEE